MTGAEAMEVARRVRSTWSGQFMDETMLTHWAEFFEGYSLEDATGALTQLQRKSERLPSQASFTEIIEGAASRRCKCPVCGLGFPSESRVREHVELIHWEVSVG